MRCEAHWSIGEKRILLMCVRGRSERRVRTPHADAAHAHMAIRLGWPPIRTSENREECVRCVHYAKVCRVFGWVVLGVCGWSPECLAGREVRWGTGAVKWRIYPGVCLLLLQSTHEHSLSIGGCAAAPLDIRVCVCVCDGSACIIY